MSIISHPNTDYHEKVAFYNDKTSGLKAITIHNTNLGQSLGGLRMYPYASDKATRVTANRMAEQRFMRTI